MRDSGVSICNGNSDSYTSLMPCRYSATTLLLFLVLVLLSGCAGGEWQYLPATKAEERTIQVVSHGWHTGIILSRQDLGRELAFLDDYLPPSPYYEFGWGEAEFYQAAHVTTWIFLKAVFWRNPSVVHVVAVPSAPAIYFRGEQLVGLNVSETGLGRLRAALRSSFAFDGSSRPYPLGKGLYGESRFFRGEDYYVVTKTCNSWTATLLEQAGVPMETVFTVRAAGVMRQAQEARKNYRCCGQGAP